MSGDASRSWPPHLGASTIAPMIHFDFDRDKLTPREAQIVAALIWVQFDARTFMLRDKSKRDLMEKVAEVVRTRLSRHLPDLDIRWEWREPASPAPSEEPEPTP